MGIFQRFRQRRRSQLVGVRPSSNGDLIKTTRTCRFELMESRRLLATGVLPIHVGAVYFEDASGEDSPSSLVGGVDGEYADQLHFTWSGGAPDTKLTELSIETDKLGDGLTIGDCFFDLSPSGLGAFASASLTILDQTDLGTVQVDVVDGGTLLMVSFADFDPGEQFVISLDVDEQGFLGPNAIAEGNEFEGSIFRAKFEAPDFYEAAGQDIFVDDYDAILAASGLNLPPDSYVPPGTVSSPVGTAGVVFDVAQVRKRIKLSGTVFEDLNQNNIQEPGDNGIVGVSLTLLKEGDPTFRLTTSTDSNGDYLFDDESIWSGTYYVVESQPTGYASVGATAGKVNGYTRGIVVDSDNIGQIELVGGEVSVENDFAEIQTSEISGYVYHDANNDGVRDIGEAPIDGVELTLLDAYGNSLGVTVTTDSNGFYRFDDLVIGEYGVAESQPTGYYDGLDTAGNRGGTANNPGDSITNVLLDSSVNAKNYNFGELLPASIAGRVHAELNGDCIHDPGEALLEDVTIHLLDHLGKRIQTTKTDVNGEFKFDDLQPGEYGLEEIQPAGYLQGKNHSGSEGGVVSGDFITQVDLGSGVDAIEYHFCEMTPASISGYVFKDGETISLGEGEPKPDPSTVRDGVFTPDDTPIGGVVLVLGDGSGATILFDGQQVTAVTDTRGFYKFSNLAPGVYTVQQIQPNGFEDSVDTVGSLGGFAVNPHDPLSSVILSTLAIDPKNDAILRIAVGMGDEAVNYNFSEVQFSRLILPPPPTPKPPKEIPKPMHYGEPKPMLSVRPEPIYKTPLPFYGGSSMPNGYTWHLSVINGGQPRRYQEGDNALTNPHNPYFNALKWTGEKMDRSRWRIVNDGSEVAIELFFGLPDATAITGDFDGDGKTEVGVFIDGQWFVDINGNGIWDHGDFWAKLGHEGDMPVTGDWDGDGKTDIGIFGPAWVGDPRAIVAEPGLPDVKNTVAGLRKNIPPEPAAAAIGWRTMKRGAHGSIRADLIDHVFHYGTAGDHPLSGDWNGDGISTVGVFREGVWHLDVDGNGRWSEDDIYAEFGREGDVPVVGDFDGDGIDQVGVYRAGKWYLDTNNNHLLDAQDKALDLGDAADQPITGDFDGDGIDSVGVYQNDVAN